jgi:hypothetical protein
MTLLKNYFKSPCISGGINNLPVQNSSSLFVELVALLVGHHGEGDANEHGRDYRDHDTALESRNHPRTGPGGLGAAERAILCVGKSRNGQRRNQNSHAPESSCCVVIHGFHVPPFSLSSRAVAGGRKAGKSSPDPTDLLADRVSQDRAGIEARIRDEKYAIFLFTKLRHSRGSNG